MKVALCFSGHPRDCQINYAFWRKFIDKYNADVFGSFWDFDENGAVFTNLYKPIEVEFESNDAFKKTTHDIASLNVKSPNVLDPFFQNTTKEFGQISMYYKIWKANLLCSSSRRNYDVVVRARTDTVLDVVDCIEINDFLNVPIGNNYCTGLKNSIGLNDCFAFGTPALMNYYAFIFLKAMDYLSDGYYAFPSEHFLAVHFSKIDVNIQYIPVRLTITRIEKNMPNEVYNNFVDNMVKYVVNSKSFRFDEYDNYSFQNFKFAKDFMDKYQNKKV